MQREENEFSGLAPPSFVAVEKRRISDTEALGKLATPHVRSGDIWGGAGLGELRKPPGPGSEGELNAHTAVLVSEKKQAPTGGSL